MKYRNIIVSICSLGLIVWIEGCTIAKISGRGAQPLLLNNPPTKVEVIQNISLSKMRVFDYTGSFDVSEVLSEYLIGSNADALINLNVTVKITVLDFLLNLVTLNLAYSRTFELQGQAVRAPNGLGYINIPGTRIIKEAHTITELNIENENYYQTLNEATMIVRTPTGFALVLYNPKLINVEE